MRTETTITKRITIGGRGTGKSEIRLIVECDEKGLPGRVSIYGGTLDLSGDAEEMERVAEALRNLRLTAIHCFRPVCEEHGYYERKTGEYECSRCEAEKAEAEAGNSDSPSIASFTGPNGNGVATRNATEHAS